MIKATSLLLVMTSLTTGLQASDDLDVLEYTANQEYSIEKTYTTPTRIIKESQWPTITDDMDFKNLQLVIHRQMKKFYRLNYKSRIKLGSITYSSKVIPASLLAFQEMLIDTKKCFEQNNKELCYQNLEQKMKVTFHFFKPKDQSNSKGSLFTGYYTPTIAAKTKKTEEFQWGVYSKPEEESLWKLSRTEIDFDGKLENTPYLHFYTNDLYENYLLHIEGGGRLEIHNEDGSISYQYITYDGTNKQSFRFIYKYMQEKGYIKSPSIRSQKNFLLANPDKWREVYSYCPSYVYFRPSDHPPLGNEGTSLTNGRSIATDRKLYRLKGLMAFIDSPKPRNFDDRGNLVKTNSSRFFVDHDTGGAIKGSARADLFYGEDKEAEFMASYTYDRGKMFFMALKPNQTAKWYRIFDKLKKYR